MLIESSKVNNQKAEINITKSVCLMSIFFTINQISFQITNTAFLKMDTLSSTYNFIVICHNFSVLLFHGGKIFLYEIFNEDFSKKLIQYTGLTS